MIFDDIDDEIESYSGEYKKGLFGKKYSVNLCLYKTYIKGQAFTYYDEELSEEPIPFEINLEDIKGIESITDKDFSGLKINYVIDEYCVKYRVYSVVLPSITNPYAIKTLVKLKEEKEEEIRKKKEEKEQKLREIEIQQQKEEKEQSQFYKSSLQFHILDKKNPYYEIEHLKQQFAAVYIDTDRSLNFLRIDGINQKENNGKIPFDKIHYYEKAGNIHYVTELNASNSVFGGSFTGGTFKKPAWWMDTEWMIRQSLRTYEPAQVELPEYSTSIQSETHKIDERNVILNYYSDIKNQYIDIELPAGIFNFLQTYLPEKKYDIVMELEKKSAEKKYENQIESGEFLRIKEGNTNYIGVSDDDDEFARKVKRLKIMYDSGLLSEKEYNNEKANILKNL